MRRNGLPSTPIALVLHGRLGRHLGLDDEAIASLSEAAALAPPDRRCREPPAGAAAAHRRPVEGDRRALYAACRQGLDAVDEHRAIMGDLELRALASGPRYRVRPVGGVVQRALRRPRDLFWWAERWRAAALNGTITRPMIPSSAERSPHCVT